MSHSHDHEQEYIRIPLEDGTEESFEVLFTFDHDETGKKYMFVTPVEDEESDDEYQEVHVFRYSEEDGKLLIEWIDENNDEEWDMIEEVFNTYLAGFEVEEEEDDAEGERVK